MIFLFTDIEGSTQQWEVNQRTMQGALAKHDAILEDTIQDYGGLIVKHTGDGVFATFESSQALLCAFEIQKKMENEDWGPLESLKVRMGMHAGEGQFRAGDWFGPDVNRTARLMAVAWGGQTLVTPRAADACTLPDGARLEDLGVHMLKDLSEPQQIFSLVHPDIVSEFPPIRTLSSRPNNLPQQTTPFIGRQDALKSVGTLIGDQACRLVTVLGPGGMGKTRLALQTAAEQIEAFPHGVYFVPLAPIESPSLLPGTIATALNYPLSEAGDPVQQLVNYLSSKEMLLVMDNFEHVLSGATVVSELLQGTPVHVVATSRARLQLQTECVFELEGLDVPESPEATIFEDFEAVEMFMTYARRAQPDFELSDDDKSAVVKLCGLLGGIPLGIELAAAWARTLSPQEIAEELAGDIDFLETSMRDVPERHRSMRAAFDYSWNLISEEERSAFAKLSVFRGGFDRQAAKEVAGANVRMLGALVDKSLIHKEGEKRFTVHELLRQFAAEKLDDDEMIALRDEHSDYFASQSYELGWMLPSSESLTALGGFNSDIDNFRSAFGWATERVKSRNLGLMATPMEIYYQYTSRYREGWEAMRAAQQVLEPLGGDPDAEKALAAVLVQVAWFGLRLGRMDDVRKAANKSLELYDQYDLWPQFGSFDNPLAVKCLLHVVSGELDEALEVCKLIDGVLDSHRDMTAPHGFYYVQTSAYSAIGDFETARKIGEKAVAVSRKRGDQWFLAYCLHELANTERALGNLDKAREYYQEALEIREVFGDPEGMASARNALGRIAGIQGRHDEAEAFLRPNIAIYQEIGDMGGLAWTYYGLGRVEMVKGHLDEARRLYIEALNITHEISFVQLATTVLLRIGELMVLDGDKDAGLTLVRTIAHHPASDAETRARAARLLESNEAELGTSPDEPVDIKTLTANTLAQLEA